MLQSSPPTLFFHLIVSDFSLFLYCFLFKYSFLNIAERRYHMEYLWLSFLPATVLTFSMCNTLDNVSSIDVPDSTDSWQLWRWVYQSILIAPCGYLGYMIQEQKVRFQASFSKRIISPTHLLTSQTDTLWFFLFMASSSEINHSLIQLVLDTGFSENLFKNDWSIEWKKWK
jgi:hypothetical protein